MIGTSFAGTQVDARRIVSVLDNLHGAIEQCNALAAHYDRFGMRDEARAYDGRSLGLRHAATLVQRLLDGLEAER